MGREWQCYLCSDAVSVGQQWWLTGCVAVFMCVVCWFVLPCCGFSLSLF